MCRHSANKMQIDQPNTVFRNMGGAKFRLSRMKPAWRSRRGTAARQWAISTAMAAWMW